MNRVGHAFMKRRMREENAVFGGEVTGHYYFRDFYYADNGFIPALLILELMSHEEHDAPRSARAASARSTSSRARSTRAWPTWPRWRTRFAALADRYRDGHTYTLDGFSAEFPDWHFNVRGSNTEPMLRLNLEALTPAADGTEAGRSARVDSGGEGQRDEFMTCRRAGMKKHLKQSSWLTPSCYDACGGCGLSIVVMLWLPKPARRVRFP